MEIWPVLDGYSLLSFSVLGLGSFFLAYLLLSRHRKTGPVKYLVLLIAILLYELLINTLYQTRLIVHVPWLFKQEWNVDLALYPLLIFLILSISGPGFRLRPFHFLLFVPALLESGWYVSRYLWLEPEVKMNMIRAFYTHPRPEPVHLFSHPLLFGKRVLLPVSFLAYGIFLLRRLTQRKGISRRMGGILLALLLFILLFKVSAHFLYRWYVAWTGDLFAEKVVNAVWLSLGLIGICLLILKELERAVNGLFSPALPKYTSSPLSSDEIEQLWQSLQTWFAREKPFRAPDLSLQQVAASLHTNPSYLSRTINSRSGTSFPAFLNAFRVKEAKRLLQDPDCQHLTIEGIGQEAGFRSKSAFYRAFKKETGRLPSEIRAQAGWSRSNS